MCVYYELWNERNEPGRLMGTVKMEYELRVGAVLHGVNFPNETGTKIVKVKALWRTGTHESLPNRYTAIVSEKV